MAGEFPKGRQFLSPGKRRRTHGEHRNVSIHGRKRDLQGTGVIAACTKEGEKHDGQSREGGQASSTVGKGWRGGPGCTVAAKKICPGPNLQDLSRKRVFADIKKNLRCDHPELLWVPNTMTSVLGETEEEKTRTEGKTCEDGGRNCRGADTSQGHPESPEAGEKCPPRDSRGSTVLPTH